MSGDVSGSSWFPAFTLGSSLASSTAEAFLSDALLCNGMSDKSTPFGDPGNLTKDLGVSSALVSNMALHSRLRRAGSLGNSWDIPSNGFFPGEDASAKVGCWPAVIQKLTEEASRIGLIDAIRSATTIDDKVRVVTNSPWLRSQIMMYIQSFRCSNSYAAVRQRAHDLSVRLHEAELARTSEQATSSSSHKGRSNRQNAKSQTSSAQSGKGQTKANRASREGPAREMNEMPKLNDGNTSYASSDHQPTAEEIDAIVEAARLTAESVSRRLSQLFSSSTQNEGSSSHPAKGSGPPSTGSASCVAYTNQAHTSFGSSTISHFLRARLISPTSDFHKCVSIASRLRDEGNAKFKERNDLASLLLYTESVIMAPFSSLELPLAFANRSAVLYHMKQYDLCIQDIELAFNYRYPETLAYKIHQRKGQCLLALGRLAQAEQSVQASIVSIQDVFPATDEKRNALLRDCYTLLDEVGRAMTAVDGVKRFPPSMADMRDQQPTDLSKTAGTAASNTTSADPGMITNGTSGVPSLATDGQSVAAMPTSGASSLGNLPRVSGDPGSVPFLPRGNYHPVFDELVNPPVVSAHDLPYASPSHVQLVDQYKKEGCQSDPIRGRYVVAESDIVVGEVLFQEKPFASVLLPENYASHCHHCYIELIAPVPCLWCTQAIYCSDVCRHRSWRTYHEFECRKLDILNSIGIGHLAERIVVLVGAAQLVYYRQALTESSTSKNQGGPCNVLQQLCTSAVYNRTRRTEQSQAESEAVQPNGIPSLANSYDRYAQVLQLVHHQDKLSGEDLFQYALTATLIALFLEQETPFFNLHSLAAHFEPVTCPTELADVCPHGPGVSLCSTVVSARASLGRNPSKSGAAGSNGAEDDTTCYLPDQPHYHVIYHKPRLNESTFSYIAALLMRHILQLVCNAGAICFVGPDREGGDVSLDELRCASPLSKAEAECMVNDKVSGACGPQSECSRHDEKVAKSQTNGDALRPSADLGESSATSSTSVDSHQSVNGCSSTTGCSTASNSSSSVAVSHQPSLVTIRQHRIATALYPSASMMNHSCAPNVTNLFYKDVLIVRALHPIAKGQEVLNSYGPRFGRHPYAQRRFDLQLQYQFECKCEYCTTKADFEQRFYALKCRHCPDGAVASIADLGDGDDHLLDDDMIEDMLIANYFTARNKSAGVQQVTSTDSDAGQSDSQGRQVRGGQGQKGGKGNKTKGGSRRESNRQRSRRKSVDDSPPSLPPTPSSNDQSSGTGSIAVCMDCGKEQRISLPSASGDVILSGVQSVVGDFGRPASPSPSCSSTCSSSTATNVSSSVPSSSAVTACSRTDNGHASISDESRHDCRHQVHGQEISQLMLAAGLYNTAVELMDQMDFANAIDILKNCLQLKQGMLYKFSFEVVELQVMLAKCYVNIGDFANSLPHLKATLESVKMRFGARSIEYGHELLKLVDILGTVVDYNSDSDDTLVRYVARTIDQAYFILELHNGPWHSTTRELATTRRTFRRRHAALLAPLPSTMGANVPANQPTTKSSISVTTQSNLVQPSAAVAR